MKKSKKIILGILTLCVALAILFFVLLVNYSTSSIDKKNMTVSVDIPTGSSFLKVTEILNKAGLMKQRFFFYSLAIIKHSRCNIRAGEYTFNTSITPAAMIDKLVRGDGKEYIILIPEDFSMQEIAARLDNEKLINKEIFFELARDKRFSKIFKY